MNGIREELYNNHRKFCGVDTPSYKKRIELDEYNKELKNKYMNEMTDEEIKLEYNSKIEKEIEFEERFARQKIEKLKSKLLV